MKNELNLPKHIAIIMDGNGRWAENKGLKRSEGHKAGLNPIKKVLAELEKYNIKYLTLYAFSTENWGRPQEEVKSLFNLLSEYLKSESGELNNKGIKLNCIGDIKQLPLKAQKALQISQKLTANNKKLTLTLALSYGSRPEILEAFKKIIPLVLNNELKLENITEETISQNLWTKTIPEPDLLIRTGGEQRLSNFLLWQLAYAELYFTQTLWPDFNETDLTLALESFTQRKRRFGLI